MLAMKREFLIGAFHAIMEKSDKEMKQDLWVILNAFRIRLQSIYGFNADLLDECDKEGSLSKVDLEIVRDHVEELQSLISEFVILIKSSAQDGQI